MLLYVSPLYPCSHCAGSIINAGLKKVVARTSGDAVSWKDSFAEVAEMFAEAGVEVIIEKSIDY